MRMMTEELNSKGLLLGGDGVTVKNCRIKEFSVKIVKFSEDLAFVSNMKAAHLYSTLPFVKHFIRRKRSDRALFF